MENAYSNALTEQQYDSQRNFVPEVSTEVSTEVATPNPTNDPTNKELFDEFYGYLNNKDVRGARKMLREYNIFNNLKSRKLNEDYDLDGYKFTKRNGELTLYKPPVPKPNVSTNETNHGTLESPMSVTKQERIPTPLIDQVPNIDNSVEHHMFYQYDIPKQNSKRIHVLENMVNQLENMYANSKNRIDTIFYVMNEYRNTLNEVIDFVNRLCASSKYPNIY